jgi:hypothetical protein
LQEIEGQKAMAEYKERAKAVLHRMAELKEARLAKEHQG